MQLNARKADILGVIKRELNLLDFNSPHFTRGYQLTLKVDIQYDLKIM